jgi:hypothetical protein
MDFFPHNVEYFQRAFTGNIARNGCNLHRISTLAVKVFDIDQEEKDEIFTFTRPHAIFPPGWGRFDSILI